MDWKETLLDILAPRSCAECLEDLPPPLQGPLCGACLRLLRPAPPLFPKRRPGELLVRAAFLYKPPMRRLLHSFKYRGRLRTGAALAGWMAGLLRSREGLLGADCVVPVPLHPRRLRERGFNQARVLAEATGRASGLPVIEGLQRVRATAPQWRLGRGERSRNTSGAFIAAGVLGRRVLLVDDVRTTGGTLEDCARALEEAGADSVRAYVLAQD